MLTTLQRCDCHWRSTYCEQRHIKPLADWLARCCRSAHACVKPRPAAGLPTRSGRGSTARSCTASPRTSTSAATSWRNLLVHRCPAQGTLRCVQGRGRVNWQVLEPAYLASLRALGLTQQPLFSFHRFLLLACTQGRMIKPAGLWRMCRLV